MIIGNEPVNPLQHEGFPSLLEIALPNDDKKYCAGLTIRQFFAAIAMQGYITSGLNGSECAAHSVMKADELINELNRKPIA